MCHAFFHVKLKEIKETHEEIEGVPRGQGPMGPKPSISNVFPIFPLVLHEKRHDT